VESIQSPNSNHRHACTQCNKRFGTRNDADRHLRSVHLKARPYICHETGCPRREQPFSRKDNYQNHLLKVHRKPPNRTNKSPALHKGKKESRGREDDLESCSREKLVDMLVAERGLRRDDQRRLREVEDELRKLRHKMEERQDIWLKLLAAKNQT